MGDRGELRGSPWNGPVHVNVTAGWAVAVEHRHTDTCLCSGSNVLVAIAGVHVCFGISWMHGVHLDRRVTELVGEVNRPGVQGALGGAVRREGLELGTICIGSRIAMRIERAEQA